MPHLPHRRLEIQPTATASQGAVGLCGGEMVQRLLDAAFECAARHAPGFRFSLARADNIELRGGMPACVAAEIAFQGRSSLTIVSEISAHGTGKPAASGRFMLIAVDDSGVPVPLPATSQHCSEDVFP